MEGGAATVNGERSLGVSGHSKSQQRTVSHQGTIDTDFIGSDDGGRKKKFGAPTKLLLFMIFILRLNDEASTKSRHGLQRK